MTMQGRRVLVTGGGSGTGADLARGFADAGGGVVAVMHDLNLSAMIADRMVLLAEGRIVAEGPPETVLQDRPLSRAYGCALRVGQAPAAGPWILPQAARI